MDKGDLGMFFQKKEHVKEKKETTEKPNLAEQKLEERHAASPLLERYLQKNMTDRMQVVSDEAIAKAIKTLLLEDEMKNDKHGN